MTASSPILASVTKRVLALLMDALPLLLLAAFAASVVDALTVWPPATMFALFCVYVAYDAGFNRAWSGVTPGRRVLGIQVVSTKGGDGLSLVKSIARPVVRILWVFAFVVAGIGSRMEWLLAMPLVIDLFLMTTLPWRQSTADFICGTLVVNTPEPQPHRAPAGPMYSATDAEFGVRPRRVK